jgi:hypothetical protein
MKGAPASHPRPEEILAWAAGHLTRTPREDEIEAHVASCTSPCGQLASICFGASDIDAEPADSPRGGVAASLAELVRVQREARGLLDGPHGRWSTMTLHPDRTRPRFVLEVAERLVYHADERAEPVLQALSWMRELALALEGPEREEAFALGLLAEGVARRAQGEHPGACYARAERLLWQRPTSLVYARICVQRALSLRALRLLDAAREQLVLAGQVYGRLGVNGRGVVLWELANLAWQGAEPRRALRLAREASSALAAEGDGLQARLALHTAASALISLRRPRAASRLLDSLEKAQGTTHERGLAAWKRGKIASLLGRGTEALTRLDAAADLLGQAGSPLAAAEALVDRAVLAGELGAVATQLESASRAVAILSTMPVHVGELAIALAELEAALATQGAVTEVLLRIRRTLAT